MKRLAAKGALASRKSGLDPDDLPALDGPRAASQWLEVIGRTVATGKLGHREAQAAVRALLDRLGADAEIQKLLKPDELAECFDLDAHLQHTDAIFARVLEQDRA